ncbi:hypothetical protein [uncultured Bacteroides sp.]|uniref:hypothetical protein n=1 Tax=uncultured Bacteroides sp. TaxID=162156 RepID=UPI0026193C1D|nr:hypothetical protein [uncultured Bacteroides sp.]
MAKPINILHPIPKCDKPFMLLPIGIYCNKELQSAASGSLVELWQDWRHERRVLVRKCRIGINNSVFTFLAKSLYGERMRIADMLAKWREVYDVPFDETECMLIEVRELNEDEV